MATDIKKALEVAVAQKRTTDKPIVKPFRGKNGGARPGSGRKPGSKNPATLEKERVLADYRQKILRGSSKLYQAQMALATGLTFLYVIRTETVGKKTIRHKPELVEDPETIEAYLAGELDNDDDEYYFMSTKEPNNSAIDSLTNRVFGKPVQPIAGDDEAPPIRLSLDV